MKSLHALPIVVGAGVDVLRVALILIVETQADRAITTSFERTIPQVDGEVAGMIVLGDDSREACDCRFDEPVPFVHPRSADRLPNLWLGFREIILQEDERFVGGGRRRIAGRLHFGTCCRCGDFSFVSFCLGSRDVVRRFLD